MIRFSATPIPDLMIIDLRVLADERGSFQKLLNRELMEAAGVPGMASEIYVSTSEKKVVRGLHFQLAPYEQAKIVYCLSGSIFDVAVDLRSSSPTFGEHFTIELPGDASKGLFVPAGFAHGLQALENNTCIANICSEVYAPEYERGISWDSCGIDWPLEGAIVSQKDQSQPDLSSYITGITT